MTADEIREEAATPAALFGFAALTVALVLSVFAPYLVILPLVLFIICCLIASFLPGVSFFLPANSRGNTGKPVVALTFDDGPDPATTPWLLDLLETQELKATFFVTGERVAGHPELVRAILEKGHDIGNHSYSHDVLLMLRTMKRLSGEVQKTQEQLRLFGIVPLAFRPPVGITNPKLAVVLHRQGLFCVNFSCRAWDGGNRFVRGMNNRILNKVRPDDIIVLHDTCPPGTVTSRDWQAEIVSILTGLQEKGLQIIPLAALLGKSIMVRTTNDG